MAYRHHLGASQTLTFNAPSLQTSATFRAPVISMQAPVLAPDLVRRPMELPEGERAAHEPLLAPRPWYRSPLVMAGAVGVAGAVGFLVWRRRKRR